MRPFSARCFVAACMLPADLDHWDETRTVRDGPAEFRIVGQVRDRVKGRPHYDRAEWCALNEGTGAWPEEGNICLQSEGWPVF
jgi:hypothetical protein